MMTTDIFGFVTIAPAMTHFDNVSRGSKKDDTEVTLCKKFSKHPKLLTL